ncbi:MAG: hypothetical protein IEMM0008_0517 [bacterium]|nr:MAG: hypothetical protein IEMM0008_0517 [bacterium]
MIFQDEILIVNLTKIIYNRIVYFVIGKHTGENGFDLVEGAKKIIESQSHHHSDELPCYAEIFRKTYGTLLVPQRIDEVGRPKTSYLKGIVT